MAIPGIPPNVASFINTSFSRWLDQVRLSIPTTLDAIDDVRLTSPTTGEVLLFTGSIFENQTLIESGIQPQDVLLDSLSALADPGSNKILGWDDPGNALAWIEPGNYLTLSSNTLDVDDVYLFNTGDIGTGNFDFTGAASLRIPYSSTYTAQSTGDIGIDSTIAGQTHGLLKFYSDAEMGVLAVPIADLTSPTSGYIPQYIDAEDTMRMVNPDSIKDWVKITAQTVASASQVDFTSGITSAYQTYKIMMTNVQISVSGGSVYLRTSTNAGSSFDAGASDYGWVRFGKSVASATTIAADEVGDYADNQIAFAHNVGTGTDPRLSGEITLYAPWDTNTTLKEIIIQCCYLRTGPNFVISHTAGHRFSTTAVNAIRILPSSGTIGGTYILYGLRA